MFDTGEVVCGYKIVESLGQGGFSHIYKARSADGSLFTLKVPFPQIVGDPAVYERFRREFIIGKKLSHPAIPRAISLNETPRGVCLVLDYVDGTSLRAYLRDRGSLPLEEALSIASQLAEALAYLHANGVCHRDLKPENIIIGKDGKVRIVDFGIALLRGARRVTWRALTDAIGTPDYMAPEQIQGKRGDAQTDIYALGTVLFETLTGTVPFQGDNPLAVMNQHLTGSPSRPRKLKPSIPPTVEGIILKSIRRDARERYKTATAFLNDIKRYDRLDASQFDFGQERQARGVVTDRQIWVLSGIIAVAFLAIVALIVVIVLLVRRAS